MRRGSFDRAPRSADWACGFRSRSRRAGLAHSGWPIRQQPSAGQLEGPRLVGIARDVVNGDYPDRAVGELGLARIGIADCSPRTTAAWSTVNARRSSSAFRLSAGNRLEKSIVAVTPHATRVLTFDEPPFAAADVL